MVKSDLMDTYAFKDDSSCGSIFKLGFGTLVYMQSSCKEIQCIREFASSCAGENNNKQKQYFFIFLKTFFVVF
jgi:hypothetical protein